MISQYSQMSIIIITKSSNIPHSNCSSVCSTSDRYVDVTVNYMFLSCVSLHHSWSFLAFYTLSSLFFHPAAHTRGFHSTKNFLRFLHERFFCWFLENKWKYLAFFKRLLAVASFLTPECFSFPQCAVYIKFNFFKHFKKVPSS